MLRISSEYIFSQYLYHLELARGRMLSFKFITLLAPALTCTCMVCTCCSSPQTPETSMYEAEWLPEWHAWSWLLQSLTFRLLCHNSELEFYIPNPEVFTRTTGLCLRPSHPLLKGYLPRIARAFSKLWICPPWSDQYIHVVCFWEMQTWFMFPLPLW